MCWAFPRHPGGGGAPAAPGGLLAAAYGGAAVVRAASGAAFRQHGRSMLAEDIIPHLPAAFCALFENSPPPQAPSAAL
jgi:NAD(P)H-hydrate repair Nnr-like enzyme with NAD(P)H-hydrate dehydratase domain